MPGMATLVGEDAATHLFRVTTGLDSVIAGEAQILRQVRAAYSSAEGVPVQFLADHLEVLYDLDIAAAAEARRAGLRYRRVAMPNTRGSFIRALAAVARTAETRLAAAHA